MSKIRRKVREGQADVLPAVDQVLSIVQKATAKVRSESLTPFWASLLDQTLHRAEAKSLVFARIHLYTPAFIRDVGFHRHHPGIVMTFPPSCFRYREGRFLADAAISIQVRLIVAGLAGRHQGQTAYHIVLV